ncbi:DUF5675 family protein [Marinoscillum luteum]|uniref:DUF5675 family protein n=1 Tax=Marinoscillum luteum TaxID=861051 RepID=A0ABW7N8E2_9BACT
MELLLTRKYFPKGTNGRLTYNGSILCYTIELPWWDNQRNISCIPEGRYLLSKRHTEKRGNHILVMDVPGRDGILFHPANDALKELEGCIAPVSVLTGPGRGDSSRKACDVLNGHVFSAKHLREDVFLKITSDGKS